MTRFWVNGLPEGSVSALDRGLHYGDGLFETMAVIDGTPLLWARHMGRLLAGCDRLGIPIPDRATLAAELERALELADRRAVVKIIVTRGSGGRGYRAPDPVEPLRIVTLNHWPDYPPSRWLEGVHVRVCATRLARQPALAGIKHLNRLEQVLARNEWRDDETAEGLMCDDRGRLVEGTMSNVFLRIRDRIATPRLDGCGVAGTLRAELLEQAEQSGLTIDQCVVTLEDLMTADEVLICNSVFGIWPVRSVAGRDFVVGEMAAALNALAARAGYDARLYGAA
ncbi:MAG: aminodeoxychorismate lyase [Gammaproteobacteria bacterium]|nr:aminodeoxychorismate lyase [Gammaproteobacteria bacterium]